MQKTTHLSAGDFRERIWRALAKRVGPGQPLHDKHVAQWVSRGPRTIEAWRTGQSSPDGYELAALIERLDPMFGPEIFDGTGCTIIRMTDARRIKEINDALAVLARAAG